MRAFLALPYFLFLGGGIAMAEHEGLVKVKETISRSLTINGEPAALQESCDIQFATKNEVGNLVAGAFTRINTYEGEVPKIGVWFVKASGIGWEIISIEPVSMYSSSLPKIRLSVVDEFDDPRYFEVRECVVRKLK